MDIINLINLLSRPLYAFIGTTIPLCHHLQMLPSESGVGKKTIFLGIYNKETMSGKTR